MPAFPIAFSLVFRGAIEVCKCGELVSREVSELHMSLLRSSGLPNVLGQSWPCADVAGALG